MMTNITTNAFTDGVPNCIICLEKHELEVTSMQFTEELFRRFVDEYGDMVYRYALIHLKDETDAQDMYQEVFLKLYEKKPEFENEEHAKAWILRVCINKCKNKLRYSFMHNHKELDDTVKNLADEETTVGNEIDMVYYLKLIPEKYRKMIYLYYYEEYSTIEIADLCAMNESTVRSRLKRGREKLKFILEKEGIVYE